MTTPTQRLADGQAEYARTIGVAELRRPYHVRLAALIERAHAWHRRTYPTDRTDGLTSPGAIDPVAVAKPCEEAGELLGAWVKFRRLAREASAGRHVIPTEVLDARRAAVKAELGDVIVATFGAAYALGIDAPELVGIVEDTLTRIESRTDDGTGSHASAPGSA